MEQQERPVPFGLLFEEIAPRPQDFIVPIYDEETDLSYVEDPKGHRGPVVEFRRAIGTQTETKVVLETTDTDPGDDRPSFSATGTITLTEVRVETTDTDPEDDHPRSCGVLGTETATFVAAEPTDTDPEDDHEYHPAWMPLGGTDTLTKVQKEPTDQD